MIALTGVTGGIGNRVAVVLHRQGLPLRLIARDASQVTGFGGTEIAQADYDDQASMALALTGVSNLLFVSGREHVDRLEQHRKVVMAAAAAGVQKVVYTSFLGASPDATFTLARQHYHTERLIREAIPSFVFLRNSLYTDFLPRLIGDDGAIRGPAGSGAVSFVTRDDIAQASAAVLTTDAYDGETFNTTGPEALTMREAAQRLSRAVGREIAYVPETIEEAYASRAHYDAPEWEVEGWITSYQAIANGEMEATSGAVETLTFHRPRTVDEFLAANPSSYEKLLS